MTADPDPDPDLARLAEQFDRLRALDAAGRRDALTSLASRDASLAAALDDLLDRDARDDGFLEQPLRHEALPADIAVAGTRIGPFTLVAPLAHGGMGVVYEARQERPDRRVALKLLRAGLGSRSAHLRFGQEAEILGRLRHPAIAQVLDSGVHDAGELGLSLPWLAMEFVPGASTLTDFAVAHDLDLAGRLALFTEVCDAVHHGHQRGVVHRDLKPTNLLVDEDGRLKVIDFGVARVVDGRLGLSSAGTLAGELVGTLAYMSPEQRAGDAHAVDARSDVYSLGVVLFELLTGERPHLLDESSLVGAGLALEREAPRRLAQVAPHLPADLDTIVEVAMAADPERRYASAEALARDVRHLLAHEPLDVAPPSNLYRLRLFARRRRALAAGLLLAVVSLVGGTAFAFHGLVRAWDAEAEARDQAGAAHAAAADARRAETEARTSADEARAAEELARLAEERALAAARDADAQRLAAEEQRGLAEDAREETALRLAEAEAVTDYLLAVLASGHVMRGGATTTVAQALEAAALLVDQELAGQPRVQLRVRGRLGHSLASLGRGALAAELLEQALVQQRELGPPDRDRLDILMSLATTALNLGDAQATRRWFAEAVALQASLPPLQDDAARLTEELEFDRVRLNVLRQSGDLRACAELAPRLIQRMIAQGVTGPALTNTIENHVDVLSNLGQYADALTLNEEVLRRKRGLGDEGRAFLVASLVQHSHILLLLGRPAEALAALDEAVAITPEELPDTHSLRVELDQHYADVHQRTGDNTLAEQFARSALEREQRSGREPSLQRTVALHAVATSLLQQDRHEEALEYERACVELLESIAAPGFYGLSMRRSTLGYLLALLGRFDEGEALMTRAADELRISLGEGDGRTLNALQRLAELPALRALSSEADAP